MRRLLSALGLCVLLGGSGVAGCSDHDVCDAGEPCECAGGSDCYLGCDSDGCDTVCHDMNHCGTVCENDCQTLSYSVIETSTSCADDCNVVCHDGTACGALCGERCRFECFAMGRCGARVGSDSVVICHDYSRCDIECTGACRVDCANPDGCSVTCLGDGGSQASQCPDGSRACGGC